ncbi:MAG: hypothetical protein M3O41_13910 [Pseudomonadota bacterium]|nr:hypothetical protein [Pseudomonadota bacterium]
MTRLTKHRCFAPQLQKYSFCTNVNFNRTDTLTSLDRFKQIAKNLQATVIIEHDPRDIGKLPAFPAAAQ